MRILIVHNYYQHKGGEDVVFQQEVDALKNKHIVETLTFQNRTGLNGLMQFACYPWNIVAANKIVQKAKTFGADIVHIHNTHYAIGPLVFRRLHQAGIKTIQTLHNYRLLDPSATLFHKNNIFLDTLHKKFPWKSVRRKALDNSFFKTFWVALTYYIHDILGTWKHVDRYLVFSNFMKKLILQSARGLSEKQLSIKVNAIDVPENININSTNASDNFVYIGRLAIEKGIRTLLEAFTTHPEYHIEIYGDGPLAEEVKSAAHKHANISYKGFQPKEILNQALATSAALIVPSIWFEGMPMTILEAYAISKPVIGSKIGALEDLIIDGYTGYHFEAGNAKELSDKLHAFDSLSEEDKQNLNENCLKEYKSKYLLERNIETLEDIYKNVIKRN